MEHDDLKASNTLEAPDRVKPHSAGKATISSKGQTEAVLGKAS